MDTAVSPHHAIQVVGDGYNLQWQVSSCGKRKIQGTEYCQSDGHKDHAVVHS